MDAKKNLENFKKLVSEEDSSWLEKAKWRRDNREWLKPKYNLTFWQKVELIPMRLMWLMADPEKRKTWHNVKKGLEKHEHKFTKPYMGEFLMCEHEGCTMCDIIEP